MLSRLSLFVLPSWRRLPTVVHAMRLRLLSTMASLLPPTITSPGGGIGSGIGSTLPRAAEHADCIYLDYQATTPVWPEVAAAAMPYLTHHWGNPSSAHAFGRPCATAVRDARAHVASLLNAKPDEILFLSCGSEADNHAIMGSLLLEERRRRANTAHLRDPRAAQAAHAAAPLPHVITSNIEHPAGKTQTILNTPFFPYVATPFLPYVRNSILFLSKIPNTPVSPYGATPFLPYVTK